MDDRETVVISASLGELDRPVNHVEQTVLYKLHRFTDENFLPRDKAMTPRLQAKIPKVFGWQLVPNYKYYLWADGNIEFQNANLIKHFRDALEGYDLVAVRHPRRNTIIWEARYLMRGLKEQSIYLVNRYNNEQWEEQYNVIKKDKDYVDDKLYMGGLFMYRNNEKVCEAMKEWWYHITRYCVQDQLSFPYAMRNLKVNVLDHDYTNWNYIKRHAHKRRDK